MTIQRSNIPDVVHLRTSPVKESGATCYRDTVHACEFSLCQRPPDGWASCGLLWRLLYSHRSQFCPSGSTVWTSLGFYCRCYPLNLPKPATLLTQRYSLPLCAACLTHRQSCTRSVQPRALQYLAYASLSLVQQSSSASLRSLYRVCLACRHVISLFKRNLLTLSCKFVSSNNSQCALYSGCFACHAF